MYIKMTEQHVGQPANYDTRIVLREHINKAGQCGISFAATNCVLDQNKSKEGIELYVRGQGSGLGDMSRGDLATCLNSRHEIPLFDLNDGWTLQSYGNDVDNCPLKYSRKQCW